jgi:AbrB family looped-hinge helix DNA binding protein
MAVSIGIPLSVRCRVNAKDMKVIQLDSAPEETDHNKATEVALVGPRVGPVGPPEDTLRQGDPLLRGDWEIERRTHRPPVVPSKGHAVAVSLTSSLHIGSALLILLPSYHPHRKPLMAVVDTLTTTVSTKGQVILPKAIRERRSWAAGTRLVVEETPEGVAEGGTGVCVDAARAGRRYARLSRPAEDTRGLGCGDNS